MFALISLTETVSRAAR